LRFLAGVLNSEEHAMPISTITRRAALTGTAAGAVAIVAGTGAALADHPDAALLELERQLEALMEPLAKAVQLCSETHDRFLAICPRQPRALRYSEKDQRAGLLPPGSGRDWCGWSIEERMAELPNNPTAQKRLQELKAIFDEFWPAVRDAAEVSGRDPAIREHGKLWDRGNEIQRRAREIEPHTFEGLAVKARMVAFEAWPLLFEEPEEDMDWDAKVLRWFIAEAMRLGGRDVLPRPRGRL
jgi:hypothetical protein